MLLAGIIFVVLGAGLWRLSRLGFAVGSHPFCRLCGFDLYMLPEDSKRCPECGADVLADDAITLGRRRPVRSGMAAGGIVILIGGLLLGLAGKVWWDDFDGSRYKSVGLLEREMLLPEVRARTRACAELQRRIEEHGLTALQMERLAQEVLKRQTSPAWEPRWGDLLQDGHRAASPGGGALLAENLWAQYLRQGMEITARVRPKVRNGDAVPIGVTCRLKVGTRWLAPGVTFVPEVAAACGGVSGQMMGRAQACDYPVPLEWTLYWQPGAGAAGGERGALAAGAQNVKLAVTMTAREGSSAVQGGAAFTLPVEVLDGGGSSVALQAPTIATQREFEAALHWRMREGQDGTISLAGGTLGKLWVAAPPVTAAFRVVLRQGEGNARQEWVIGRFMVQPGDAATVPLALPAGGGPVPGEAEIVCLPDSTLAEATVQVLEVWGAEVVRGVKLGP
jgi:hypothetical protein